ncbi:DUF3347 domain-containing protein, partial [Myxococcota bacterium]|nr:DUF3347 domain-containing protein [Myxococcota bacterium]
MRTLHTSLATLLAVATLAVISPTATAAKDARSGVLDGYLAAHAALAGDTTKGLKDAAASMEKSAAQLPKDQKELGERVRTHAKALGGAKDLASAREAFKPLSEAVIALAAKGPELKAKGLAVFECSMV